MKNMYVDIRILTNIIYQMKINGYRITETIRICFEHMTKVLKL